MSLDYIFFIIHLSRSLRGRFHQSADAAAATVDRENVSTSHCLAVGGLQTLHVGDGREGPCTALLTVTNRY